MCRKRRTLKGAMTLLVCLLFYSSSFLRKSSTVVPVAIYLSAFTSSSLHQCPSHGPAMMFPMRCQPECQHWYLLYSCLIWGSWKRAFRLAILSARAGQDEVPGYLRIHSCACTHYFNTCHRGLLAMSFCFWAPGRRFIFFGHE